jgi:predicted nuclease of predicted toxin-antitoxin system
MARFLVDAQLPPALARWLASQGHTAEHVNDVGLDGADDRRIWDHALHVTGMIVTKDEDFAIRKSLEPGGPAVLWVRVGNTRKQALLNWFETMLPSIVLSIEAGEQLIELV